MITPSSLKTVLRGLALSVCLIFILAAPSLRAEEIPKFSSPEINAFVTKYVGLIDAYVKAVADKEEAKVPGLTKQVLDLLSNEGPAIDAKLTAEERPRFEKFMDSYSDKWKNAEPKG